MSEIQLDDKNTWVFTNGSPQLREAIIHGYECKGLYLKERIAVDYPNFRVNDLSKAQKVDLPSFRGLREAMKYEGAYVANQVTLKGEVLAVDDYLGEYQIIKEVRKPWYLAYQRIDVFKLQMVAVVILSILINNSPDRFMATKNRTGEGCDS
jgi:hypothetical protein